MTAMTITELQKFIKQTNLMRKDFDKYPTQTDRLTTEQIAELGDCIEMALEPENLTCDGELSGVMVMKKRRSLASAIKELAHLADKIGEKQ